MGFSIAFLLLATPLAATVVVGAGPLVPGVFEIRFTIETCGAVSRNPLYNGFLPSTSCFLQASWVYAAWFVFIAGIGSCVNYLNAAFRESPNWAPYENG